MAPTLETDNVYAKYLLPLKPHIEALPDPELLNPVKKLATEVLPTAIDCRHKEDTLLYLKCPTSTPKPVRYGFKLKSQVDSVKHSSEFKIWPSKQMRKLKSAKLSSQNI